MIYNIATFDTDVIRGPWTTAPYDGHFGLNPWGYAFLVANWCAFSLGMASALAASSMTHAYEKLRTNVERHRFTSALSSFASVIGLLFRLALISFIVGFGLFGMAKMVRSMAWLKSLFVVWSMG